MRRTAYALGVAVVLVFAAGCGGSSSKSSGTTTATTGANSDKLVALISDIGKFNDRSFNQSQKEGLDRKKANLIIAAGFLLADATNTVAKDNPNIHFAITDYDVKGTPFNGRKNVMGLTYAANESGCLVGYLAAEMAKKQGGKQIIGAVGGLKIPPV